MDDGSRSHGRGGGVMFLKDWTTQQIDDELRGKRVDTRGIGYALQNLLGFEMDVGQQVARGKFVVSKEFADSNGQLLTGVTSYLAEGLGSSAGSAANEGNRIAGIELNINNLHPAYVGQEVTVIANLLKRINSVQTWEIKFETECRREPLSNTETQGEHPNEKVLVALSRLTVMEQNASGAQMPRSQKMERKSLSSKL